MAASGASGRSLASRLAWFVGLWAAGVAALGVIGLLIRTALAS
ncbi:MAG: DUF2474 family protein [Rhodospirillales bacterium]|nr:DUF2474 family protein [Rhodospirillales bacterium]